MAQFPEVEELFEAGRLHRVAAGDPRGRRRIGRRGGDGCRRRAGRAGADLHTGQGSCAVRDRRREGGATRPAPRDPLRPRRGVVEKFGVPPESIPDYLGVVGDSADGFPGLSGWGAKSAAKILTRGSATSTRCHSTSPSGRASTCEARRSWPAPSRINFEDALLFRRIATVDLDAPVSATVDELAWQGPRAGFDERCDRARRASGSRPAPTSCSGRSGDGRGGGDLACGRERSGPR